ncbi:hypothetical protein [Necropsobacter massiliensis]|uniref:hypothetical protein n=1 Tax=Necropsobacter massiliensis TaxID=1400001 RepID=UPI000AEE198D|nr:hypothetical protein [Necropsobacter massiliensis]
MWRKLGLWICLFAMWGCATPLTVKQLPLSVTETRLFKLMQLQPKSQATLLALQSSPQQWRWVQTDALGAPVARLLLTQQGWRNDGFIIPNRRAQQLFSAIAVYLHPALPLFEFSEIRRMADGQHYYMYGEEVWCITSTPKGADIALPDNSRWRLEEIEQ